ncbi:hypothetical protein G9444_2437 [Rhodococcus erythropolis]|uniref:Uncharacterized protein n=1 Tax=Rhodococcus erythropolis TaxID=1833 RepID=A0A6G9CSR0_RHOER|nr:hypothetical protein [Rhodococcus erythropolis]QIP39681.1 hypothetical protein G9444_2437 [Rhodococcus erythropolis]
MTNITAAEYRTAEKVARSLGFVTAQSYADHAARLESVGLTLDTQLAQTLRQVASPSFADRADYWGTLAAAALEFLASAGRLIPAGGMALTAERLAELIKHAPDPNDGDYNDGYVAALTDLRDALFPATEPAEDSVGDPLQAWKEFLKPKPIGWYRTMTPQFATKHFGFPGVIGSKVFWTHTASDGGKWAWDGDDWELRYYPPAPAEPAEEETKAEVGGDFIEIVFDGPPEAVSGRFVEVENPQGASISVGEWIDRGDGFWALRIPYPSSPVVPAPTESEWKRIEDVPVGVPFKDREGSGLVKLADGQFGYVDNYRETSKTLAEFAPFVSAEEG